MKQDWDGHANKARIQFHAEAATCPSLPPPMNTFSHSPKIRSKLSNLLFSFLTKSDRNSASSLIKAKPLSLSAVFFFFFFFFTVADSFIQLAAKISYRAPPKMDRRLWTLLTYVHSLAGPVMMLLYPLYASIIAIETPSKVDDEQWLAYWILYSFLTLLEMLIQPILERIPIWYDMKLALVAWLVLPHFRGAAYIYDRFVREKIKKYGGVDRRQSSPNGKPRNKFVDFLTPKKGEQKAY